MSFARRRVCWAGDPYPPAEPARLTAWVDHLDVDLEAAQAALRLPVDQLPPLPGEPVPAAPARPLGAYARRARRSG